MYLCLDSFWQNRNEVLFILKVGVLSNCLALRHDLLWELKLACRKLLKIVLELEYFDHFAFLMAAVVCFSSVLFVGRIVILSISWCIAGIPFPFSGASTLQLTTENVKR